jgi:hypothetical protein
MPIAKRKPRARALSISGLLLATGSLLALLVSACGDNTPTPTIILPTPIPTTVIPTGSATVEVVTIPPVNTPGATVTVSGSTGSTTSAATSSSDQANTIKGIDGQYYWVIEPIRSFYEANSWLGLPLGGMREARPDGYNWDGVYQNFQRGRVEAHRDPVGKYSLMLGLVNQELLELKKANK